MRRFLPPVWVLSAALVLVGVASFAVVDRQALHWYAVENPTPTMVPAATPVPDVVVGVQRLCDLVGRSGGPPTGSTVRLFQSGGCDGVPDQVKLNDRIEVTVRTGTGGSYVVTVAPDSTVSVGDTWRR